MNDIEVYNHNDVYSFIKCADRGIQRELSDFFTFKVPNAHFTPKYKAKLWDGKIRLFNWQTCQLYKGLVPYIDTFCNERQYEVEFVDEPKRKEVTKKEIEAFIKKLKPHGGGNPIEPREAQVDALYEIINKKRCLILSPTGSGKSFIIYVALRWILAKKQQGKFLIVVPTTSLVEQLFSDFDDYASAIRWNSEKFVHKIYSGKDKQTDKPIVISTWQSLYKMPKSYFKQFSSVIIDECHLAKADSLKGIMEKLETCPNRVGLTGTLDESQTHKLVLEGLFGLATQVTTTKEMMDNDELAKLTIDAIVLRYSDEECQAATKFKYQDERDFLVLHEKRNEFIKNLTLCLKGNTLVLFQLVEKHGKPLYQLIKKAAGKKKKVFFIFGGTDTEEREVIRKIVEEEKNAIIIASYGTYSTGINIKNLHNIIFASPYKSRVKVLQSLGRGLRMSATKTSAKLFDIVDDLRWKKKVNFVLKHFMKRINIYTKEQFEYKIININLHGDKQCSASKRKNPKRKT